MSIPKWFWVYIENWACLKKLSMLKPNFEKADGLGISNWLVKIVTTLEYFKHFICTLQTNKEMVSFLSMQNGMRQIFWKNTTVCTFDLLFVRRRRVTAVWSTNAFWRDFFLSNKHRAVSEKYVSPPALQIFNLEENFLKVKSIRVSIKVGY